MKSVKKIKKNSAELKVKDVKWTTAEKVNKNYPADWGSPYKPGTRVKEVVIDSNEEFIRVHGIANQKRDWIMRKKDIQGLTAQQIKEKYAIPNVPTQISEVKIPKGTKVRIGIAGPQPKFNAKGGGVQYEILNNRNNVKYKLIGSVE